MLDKNYMTVMLTVLKGNQWESLCRKVWCCFPVWIHTVDYSSGTESLGEKDFSPNSCGFSYFCSSSLFGFFLSVFKTFKISNLFAVLSLKLPIFS